MNEISEWEANEKLDYLNWDLEQTVSWLAGQVKLRQYANTFYLKKINMAVLDKMNVEKLEEKLGIGNVEHRVRIIAAIDDLRKFKKYSKMLASGVLDNEIRSARVEFDQINGKIIKLKEKIRKRKHESRQVVEFKELNNQYLCARQ